MIRPGSEYFVSLLAISVFLRQDPDRAFLVFRRQHDEPVFRLQLRAAVRMIVS